MTDTQPLAPIPTSATNTSEGDNQVEQIVTPWDVVGGAKGVDYERLIETFGVSRIEPALLERFERLTGRKPHKWLRRGYFFSHRLRTQSL